MAYSRILAALDLSDESNEVLAAATAQAEIQNNAELHLVTVVKPLRHAVGGLDGTGMTAIANIEAQLRKSADDHAEKWAKETGIPRDRIHITVGNPSIEIKALADEIQAGLIVMGTHGRHGLGLLLGSTANGVLHGVNCDVLTIRIH